MVMQEPGKEQFLKQYSILCIKHRFNTVHVSCYLLQLCSFCVHKSITNNSRKINSLKAEFSKFLNLSGEKKPHILQQFPINLVLHIENTAMWHERRQDMAISTRERGISRFRRCGSGLHIWPPRAPILGVGKFWEVI
jgi:hypothetical protein